MINAALPLLARLDKVIRTPLLFEQLTLKINFSLYVALPKISYEGESNENLKYIF